MQLCWLTDPHFDHLKAQLDGYGAVISNSGADAVLITGDIGESDTVVRLLSKFAEDFGKAIYFVLGNHDFYCGSILDTKLKVSEAFLGTNAKFLDNAEPYILDDATAVVGHSGFYDAILGNPYRSKVVMSDFSLIEELRSNYNRYAWQYDYGRDALIKFLNGYGEYCAHEANESLLKALSIRRDVIFLTHVSPFKAVAVHRGVVSDDNWLPWFSCEAMGRMLTHVADTHPNNRILCLSGHSHGSARYFKKPNLLCLGGHADYGFRITAGEFTLPLQDYGDL